MIRFNNDYNHGALDSILSALTATNTGSFAGYGEDIWCQRAETVIKQLVSREDALIKFVPGATQANLVVIAAALSPIQSVIAADTGHINCHEAASIENTGHKILALPNTDGKITAGQIAACAAAYYDGGAPEYLTEPKLVYLSFPTEKGTLYSKQELQSIREVCRKYGMYLFVDGARMGYGLGAADNDLTLKDFAELTDVFYIGGTKCGALFGEALVITEPALQYRFKAYMKQHGAVYFGAIGGCGALLSKCIKKAEVIAYEDLGAEALRRLEVEDFPVTVIIDALGNDLYETGRRAYLEQCNGKQPH